MQHRAFNVKPYEILSFDLMCSWTAFDRLYEKIAVSRSQRFGARLVANINDKNCDEIIAFTA